VPIEVRRGDKRCFGGALRLAVVGRYADGGCSGSMTLEGGELGDTSTLMDPSVFEATRASKHHREMTRFRTCLLTAGRQRASAARMAPSIGCRRYVDG
jgi:hypothetical protein